VKKFVPILLLLFVLPALGSVIKIEGMPQSIKQGEVFKAKFVLDPESMQSFSQQNLRGKTVAETLYIYSLTPLIKKADGRSFEAEAGLIFIKVPQAKKLTLSQGGETFIFELPEITVVPTEERPDYVYGEFTVAEGARLFGWIVGGIALCLLLVLGLRFKKSSSLKRALRAKRKKLKDDLLGASSYLEVVSVWEKKPAYLEAFPQLEGDFKNLEKVLYRFIFKKHQSEEEKSAVLSAYREFVNQVRGGLDGV
jgi:hypothetical protein